MDSRMCFSFLVLFMMVFPLGIKCQNQDWLHEWASEVATVYAEEMEMEDVTILIEDLLEMARNPININSAGREDLERIFFLTDLQVENILYKRYVNGDYKTIYELQAVEDLPVEVIKRLDPLLDFREREDTQRRLRVWGDSFFRSGLQLETAAGFKDNEDGERAYQGGSYKLYSRTSLHSNRGFSAGMILEKDPGEPMFSDRINGLDLMSGYIHYENSSKWLREIGVGQYHASAGQGLVLQSGMPMRKSSMVTNLRNRKSSFRPSLSASEATGLKGGFATVGFGKLEITPFFSLKKRDGRINSDGVMTSLREDGMHRTLMELEQRHNTNESVYGMRASFSGKWFQVQAGHLWYQLDRSLKPEIKPYNQFYFSGNQTSNSWFSYLVSKEKLLLFGEFAVNEFSEMALSNGLLWRVAPGFTLAAAHRYISQKYNSPLAGPMTESSAFSGERGVYAGFKWELPRQFTISSYFDYYRFEWLKFRVDAPSSGFDWLGFLEKGFSRDASLGVKFRHREKPENWNLDEAENIIGKAVYDQIKLQYRHDLSGGWQFTTMAQWHFVESGNQNEEGTMLAQDLKWQNKRISITGRYALFSTSDYLARLYAYEPNVLYMFSVPAYSGKGSRCLLLINYKLYNWLHLWFRAARWQYNDRQTTGSGHQAIDSNIKTHFTFQMRVKF
ncbi:helix-hairpin-helix domain-containing protein [Marinilabilia sp.]